MFKGLAFGSFFEFKSFDFIFLESKHHIMMFVFGFKLGHKYYNKVIGACNKNANAHNCSKVKNCQQVNKYKQLTAWTWGYFQILKCDTFIACICCQRNGCKVDFIANILSIHSFTSLIM